MLYGLIMVFSFRDAGPEDAETLAALHIEGWKAAYGDLVTQSAPGMDARRADWGRWLAEGLTPVIAYKENKPTGFTSFGKLKTVPPGSSPIRPLYSGEIYALYILPEFWRQGLGRQLMAEAARRLKTQRHSSLCLWVLDSNQRANDFYKALGGQRCGKKDSVVGGATVREICYGWRNVEKLWHLST